MLLYQSLVSKFVIVEFSLLGRSRLSRPLNGEILAGVGGVYIAIEQDEWDNTHDDMMEMSI